MTPHLCKISKYAWTKIDLCLKPSLTEGTKDWFKKRKAENQRSVQVDRIFRKKTDSRSCDKVAGQKMIYGPRTRKEAVKSRA